MNADGAELLRDGNNVMYYLRGGIVARIGAPGSRDTALREVAVSRWLETAGIPATQAIADLPQNVLVDDRPITWWKLLPPHRPATPKDLGGALRRLHHLDAPKNLHLPEHDPFSGIRDRVRQATWMSDDDQAWLLAHENTLTDAYDSVSTPLDRGVIHGDAWQGNVAVLDDDTTVLLDLEAVSHGYRAWDLIQIAVDVTDFERISPETYCEFVASYGGYDLTTSSDFRTFADIQVLRWLAFALSKAADDPAAMRECRHRLSCVRGDIPRPWKWTAL
ncbi:phosphotransferase [Amycolatopsis keratiniphila]|uniref:phosphotransferase n=1 Tax=Amycolatopsis keratiniphila TaxID=129921 RepID=UPI00087A1C14|nr:phosphotransferase [Amycolatopsis keratiniphila]SDU67274.1 Ser/Thr protein kinase RdoA involved in Cpx stress response, MazF antagonist [Amycolatopsis keratiniphila]